MSKSAHTEAQIIGAMKQVEAGRKAEARGQRRVEAGLRIGKTMLFSRQLGDQAATFTCSMWRLRAALASGSIRYQAVRNPQKQWKRVNSGLGSTLWNSC